MKTTYVHCRLRIGDIVYSFDGPLRIFNDWISTVIVGVCSPTPPHGGVRVDYFSVDVAT